MILNMKDTVSRRHLPKMKYFLQLLRLIELHELFNLLSPLELVDVDFSAPS